MTGRPALRSLDALLFGFVLVPLAAVIMGSPDCWYSATRKCPGQLENEGLVEKSQQEHPSPHGNGCSSGDSCRLTSSELGGSIQGLDEPKCEDDCQLTD